jgi:hypothetical protein
LLANFLACLLDATELDRGLTAGLVDGHAFCDVVFDLAGDVVAQLFIELIDGSVAKEPDLLAA